MPHSKQPPKRKSSAAAPQRNVAPIPFFDYQRQLAGIRAEIDAAITRVFTSGKLILGPEVAAFEEACARWCGVTHGVGVNSGTDAIKIALRALGIGEGATVITVANTAVPTVSAIRETGATPLFVDTDAYGSIDATQIEKHIRKNTKAIVVVHLYGHPCDMRSIMRIARRHGLRVIEDCAQAIGSRFNGKKVGGFGDVGCFSFYPTKNLGAYGDGGMIVTRSKQLAARCRELRMYGMRGTYYAQEEGYNSRLDELHAAMLRVKLEHLETWNTRRRAIAAQYRALIVNPQVMVPEERENGTSSYHLFVIRCPKRDALKAHLAAHDIITGIHYPFPIHLQRAYRFLGYKKGSLPRTEAYAKQILSLPLFPELTNEEIERIAHVINTFTG